MAPVSWLPDNSRLRRLVRLPNSVGMTPVSWLLSRLRDVRLPNSVGMTPVSWLLPRLRCERLLRLPNSVGMTPVSWLLLRIRCESLLRLPNSVGMVPLRLLSRRSTNRTRPGVALTPYQSSTGSSLNQFVLSVQLAPSVAL